MSEINIDPNLVIADLLEQIKKLSGDNAVLRTALNQIQAHNNAPESDQSIVSDTVVD